MNDFLASNDTFWNSHGHHSFDIRALPSIVGKYKGSWKIPSNENLKAQFIIDIASETKGQIVLLLLDREQSISSKCSRDFIPKKDLGIDEKENAVNIFMHNCNPSILGEAYSQFAFKIPMNMQKGQQKSLDLSGLNEDFNWKPEGYVDLQKN